MRVGSDTGGTFTDLVGADGRVAKVPSTSDDPTDAVRSGLEVLDATSPDVLAHGTTVATNALLERRLATVALVTSPGMRDVIEIARQDRPSLYDLAVRRPEPLVPRQLRFEVGGRLDAAGREVSPIDTSTLPELDVGVDAVAVVLLHADLEPSHERAVAAALVDSGVDVCCSHEVSPEMREYERTVTTVVNAALRPRCRAYLQGLAGLANEVVVMTSAAGLMDATDAAELPAALLLSGPAGGVRAAVEVAVANGFPDAVTLDMGGTSTDVGLMVGGVPSPAAEREVGGFTVRFPSLDVLTIGAGGGSIATIDAGGALVVGPRSAGAEPGPACYDRGGTEPTVTDANIAAGRIADGAEMGGLVLRRDLAAAALQRADVTAEGVISVVNANMERALRSATVERGVDPRGLALVAFGGAGPLHACELADSLGITTVLVPARAGVLSAVGILTAPTRRDLVRSWPTPQDHDGVAAAADELGREAMRLVGADAVVATSVDCRYEGQSHEITVPTVDDFAAEHERRNGYARPGAVIEVIAVRASAELPASVSMSDLPVVHRLDGAVAGPQTIAEPDCTVWVPAGWTATEGVAGALVIDRDGGRSL
jgi:N-methylhydantoinase A/oxoprolinase/acetone carboxylase beta subunit